jgi:hypothetical protein
VLGTFSSHVFQECSKILFIVVFFPNFFLPFQGFFCLRIKRGLFQLHDIFMCYSVCTIFLTFRPHYGPGVDSVFDRNEYQEYFLWGKGDRCVGLTNLPPSCADCLEILHPQPAGNFRACTGLCRDCFNFYCLFDSHVGYMCFISV